MTQPHALDGLNSAGQSPTHVARDSHALVIEPMIWGHSDAVLDIERASFGADAWTEGQFWSELGAPAELKQYIVAVVDDSVVGYAAVQFIAPEAEVLTVAVQPAWRGAGIASALVAELETLARGRRCELMHLEVEQSNSAARGLYAHLGYAESGLRPNYYGRGRDAVLMSKSIAGFGRGTGDGAEGDDQAIRRESHD